MSNHLDMAISLLRAFQSHIGPRCPADADDAATWRKIDETCAAIALMRGQSEESEADALRRRLHKLADYWIGITRDQDIAHRDRPLLEMYDKGLTKCATDLRKKLAEGPSR